MQVIVHDVDKVNNRVAQRVPTPAYFNDGKKQVFLARNDRTGRLEGTALVEWTAYRQLLVSFDPKMSTQKKEVLKSQIKDSLDYLHRRYVFL